MADERVKDMQNVIEMSHVTKDYGKNKGIFDFNFAVRKGEVYGFVGTNGSGKTTTIRNMMGFIKPNAGRITINGLDSWTDAYEIKKQVGYIPGQIDFPDVGTGADFLKIQADFLGLKDLSYMNQLIDMFKLDIGAQLKRMSKGMKQKTAIVAAFMGEPDLLIMDEPSTGLDPMMRDQLIALILEQKKKGKTIFMSSHIFKELEETCDRVTFIHNGQLIKNMSLAELDKYEDREYQIGFADENDYTIFLTCGIPLVSKSDTHRHLVARVAKGQINQLFHVLHTCSVRYINYRPFTLEWYYNNFIEKTGGSGND